jgi:hypothetical protein
MRYGCSAPLVRKIICVPVSSFTLPPLQWMNESSGPPDAAEPKTRPGMPITPRLMLVSVVAGLAVPFVEVASVPELPLPPNVPVDGESCPVQFHAYP